MLHINGNLNAHKQVSNGLNELLKDNKLIDVWRFKNPVTKMYTWHSNTNPPTFCRLDYCLVSNNIFNDVSECNISNCFKTDHLTVSMVINTFSTKRGPGSLKINNYFLLETEYQEKVKEAIREISNFNKDANANTLWKLIKGTVKIRL